MPPISETYAKWKNTLVDELKKYPNTKQYYDTLILKNANRKEDEKLQVDQRKTMAYNYIFTFFLDSRFDKAMSKLDADVADKYMGDLTTFLKFQWDLQQPTRENHGLGKKMTPEDYDRLQKGYAHMMKGTADVLKSLTKPEDAGISRVLKGIQMSLKNDYSKVSTIAMKKEPVTLEMALNNAGPVDVIGATDTQNTLGGNQSSRRVITIVDGNGSERTGLFTPKSKSSSTDHTILNNQLKANEGARVDNRNSAMSTVAGLLGRPKLLAFSQEMTLDGERTERNKTGSGTFMELATGTDLNRILPDDDILKINYSENYDLFTDNAKQDMMDMSIIDYLCMNVDRHAGNIMYSYKSNDKGQMQLDKLVGIDNDSSFGNLELDVNKPVNRLPALKDLVCISEEMAQRLEAMTPESMRAAMAPYGFDPDELDRMEERLTNLQQSLQRGKEFAAERLSKPEEMNQFLERGVEYMNDTKGRFRDPMLVVVSKEKLKDLKVDGMSKVTPVVFRKNNRKSQMTGGVFNMCRKVHTAEERQKYLRDAEINKQQNLKQIKGSQKLVNGTNNLQALASASASKMTALIKGSKIKTSFIRGTSPEFERVVETMNVIEEYSKKVAQSGHRMTDMEHNCFTELYQRLNKDCTDYLKHKKEQVAQGKSLSDYAKDRYEFIQNIQQDSIAFRNRFYQSWDNEMQRENMRAVQMVEDVQKLNKELDAVNALQKASNRLASLENPKNHPHDQTTEQAQAERDDAKRDYDRVKNELPEKIAAQAATFQKFAEAHGKDPLYQSAIQETARKLSHAIAVCPNPQACGITNEFRDSLAEMQKPKAPEKAPVTNTVKPLPGKRAIS